MLVWPKWPRISGYLSELWMPLNSFARNQTLPRSFAFLVEHVPIEYLIGLVNVVAYWQQPRLYPENSNPESGHMVIHMDPT
jgi:hypothetical protein